MIIMTSLGQRHDCDTLRSYGVARCLTKPVKQSQLLDCLMTVMADHAVVPLSAREMSEDTGVSGGVSGGVPGMPGGEDASGVGALARGQVRRRVLVAEDNVVNQRVALHQLRRLGYAADAVANGEEAVTALSRVAYDLVLMDCQMPELDGYAATMAIRRREGAGPRTPIIAMTANALQGEREKCLDAGMDAYLSKPVKFDELDAMLARWLRTRVDSDEEDAGSTAIRTSA
jgi:CheY-like chemotaxis protein